ncbi:UNVERIFIED_CONTAM: hypothetical protein GTU68_036267, partial [Idotea baltica]|nr:hypothetical protein [Idotea baltica]
VRSKICGITCIKDALAASQLGADAIGLVFYAQSPRAVSIAQAEEITAASPPFLTTVGLFVNADPAWVQDVLAHVPLNTLQFHGDETEKYCQQFNKPYIKAIRIKHEDTADSVQRKVDLYTSASGILLDTFSPQMYGGTGDVFDWSIIPNNCSSPVLLAGGLTPENLSAALEQSQPYAVDVSGGVEQAKGIKDVEKMQAFLSLCRK